MASKAKSTSKASQTGAGAGTETRRTTSSAERDQATTRLDQITDTGGDEANMGAMVNLTRSWDANSKLTYDNLLNALSMQATEAQTNVTNINAARLQMITNMTANADALQKQLIKHSDIATDRTWTQSNELETMLAAKSGVQADAMVALLAKAIADAINK